MIETNYGESVNVQGRIIVSPATGTFNPSVTTTQNIAEGTAIGQVDGPGASHPVLSPFAGQLVEIFASPGQRIREGEKIAWMHTA